MCVRGAVRSVERLIWPGSPLSCLDDEELGFLGSPFDEYEENARLVGLDIIRSV